MSNRMRAGAIAGVMCGVFFGSVAAGASRDDVSVESRPEERCLASSGRLPATVQVDEPLLHHVRSMLQSDDFRRQCEELAAKPWVYVRVRLSLTDLPQAFRARSVILRTLDGPIIASVEIGRGTDWSEWVAHELEHVLEQADGLRKADLARQHDSWLSADSVFETGRAIRAGQMVRRQMRAPKRAAALGTD